MFLTFFSFIVACYSCFVLWQDNGVGMPHDKIPMMLGIGERGHQRGHRVAVV